MVAMDKYDAVVPSLDAEIVPASVVARATGFPGICASRAGVVSPALQFFQKRIHWICHHLPPPFPPVSIQTRTVAAFQRDILPIFRSGGGKRPEDRIRSTALRDTFRIWARSAIERSGWIAQGSIIPDLTDDRAASG
jgi:hypothetical protein